MKNFRTEFKWSVLFSLMGLFWMLLERISGLHDRYLDYQMYLTTLFLIPAVWFYVLALKEKKKRDFNGVMSYKQGFVSGLILSLMIALISPLTQWITSYIISPDYFKNAIKRSVEIGYYDSTREAAANFNFQNYAVQGATGALITGLLFTFILMFFLQTKTGRKKPEHRV